MSELTQRVITANLLDDRRDILEHFLKATQITNKSDGTYSHKFNCGIVRTATSGGMPDNDVMFVLGRIMFPDIVKDHKIMGHVLDEHLSQAWRDFNFVNTSLLDVAEAKTFTFTIIVDVKFVRIELEIELLHNSMKLSHERKFR